MPHVSIVIPTYNRAALLAKAVRSALQQTYQDYELIVVDDGSSDDTSRRISVFGDRVHYRRLEHSGRLGLVRNHGILAARGDVIAFLDDDDLWYPHKLERQIALLENDRSIGFIYSDARLLFPDGSLSAPVLSARQKRPELILDLLLASCCIHPSTMVVRRPLFDSLGLFDEDLSSQEDYAYWLQLARLSRAACVPEPLVVVRHHPTNHFRSREVTTYQNAISVLERALSAPPLTLRQRLGGRITLARWNSHLGRALMRGGELGNAQQHLVRSLRWNPLQRQAWVALKDSYIGRS